jgi:peptidoglycan/xylan/chitin deacetylase (PgdA/CDA1 family)
MYHYLGEPPTAEDRPYYVSERRFRIQLRQLRAEGFETIDLPTAVRGLQGKREIPRRSVVITFDDGHRSFLDMGVRALTDFGFQATMFVITNRVGRDGYLSWNQIRELSDLGMAFEPHGTDHAILTRIPLDAMRQEIEDSKRVLEEQLGRPARCFAYRGGHFNEQVRAAVRDAGYECAVCSRQGLNHTDADLFALLRRSIKEEDGVGLFYEKVTGRRQNPLRNWLRYWLN